MCPGGCSIKIGLRRRPINLPSRRPIRIFMEQPFWKADSQIGFREGWFSRTRIGLREGRFSRIGLPARLALGLVFLEGWFSNRLSGKLINQPSPKANFYGTASWFRLSVIKHLRMYNIKIIFCLLPYKLKPKRSFCYERGIKPFSLNADEHRADM